MSGILSEGLAMMLIGMGTVLVFLCILILSMKMMSIIVAKINQIFPEPVAQTAGAVKKRSADGDDSEIAAAIISAMFGNK